MPKHLQKSLQDYLSKIKRETGKIQLSSNSFSSSKNWVLSGCKHPKTHSFSMNRKQKKRSKKSKSNAEDDNDQDSGHAATLSDIDRFLEENFKSLCIRDDDDDADEHNHNNNEKKKKNKKNKPEEHDRNDNEDEEDDDDDKFKSPWGGPAVFDSPKLSEAATDLCKSERFFAAPGSPSLLTEEARASMATTTTSTSEDVSSSSNSSIIRHGADDGGSEAAVLPENCIAVLKYTPEPYEDFRRSMAEMVETRAGLKGPEVDWDFMEELLFCYLDLNDKKSHRFILSAFVDLIVLLRKNKRTRSRKGVARSRSNQAARVRLRRKLKQHV